MKKQFTLITLITIAFIGIWSVMKSPDEAPPPERAPNYVDAYIKDFTLVSMNEKGQPGYILTADLLEHFNDTGDSEVTEPVFNIKKDDNSWVISARSGTIDNDNTWVTLIDDVVMLQTDAAVPLKLTTSKMRFNTKTQIADTDRQVDITQGGLAVRSNGMKFNNVTGTLELLAGVNGVYVKP